MNTEAQELRSWQGEYTKSDIIARLEAHARADQIIQKLTWNEEYKKGCAIGCVLNEYRHDRFPSALGLPVWLARLVDNIFEGLPVAEAKNFAIDWARAIPENINIEPVKHKFLIFVLAECRELVRVLKISDELKKQIISANEGVAEAHQRAIKTGEWQIDPAVRAAVADAYAYAAATYAADAADAADVAAAAAAAAAADAADAATAYAADAAADAADAAAATYAAAAVTRRKAWIRYATELIRLLNEAA